MQSISLRLSCWQTASAVSWLNPVKRARYRTLSPPLNTFGERVGRRKLLAHLELRHAQMLLRFVLVVEGADLDQPSIVCVRRGSRDRGTYRFNLSQFSPRVREVSRPRNRHWLSGRDNLARLISRRC